MDDINYANEIDKLNKKNKTTFMLGFVIGQMIYFCFIGIMGYFLWLNAHWSVSLPLSLVLLRHWIADMAGKIKELNNL